MAPVADDFSPWERKPTEPDVSQGAVVSQVVGVDTWLRIAYHRPGVKGRNVWKDEGARGRPLVPADGSAWRAGANEATTFEASSDVLVEGKPLAAGRYSLFMIPGDEHWTVVFNSVADQWGAYSYDQEQDVLRVEVAPQEAPHVEWLTYTFDDPLADSVRPTLRWAELAVPFTVTLPKDG
ncbi:MAG: DUF2911 domain-containing protein [Planctomycetes bacterium]|nr:DUF2911 domain-containing protein [Planctomycetota bacterium]